MGQEGNTTKSGRASSWTAVGASVAAGLLRLGVLPANLTPVGALGLFGGARLRSWHAFALPLAVMTVSDLLLWLIRGYQPFDPFVYASFLLYVVIARLLCQKRALWRVGAASLLGSVQFYLITNFGAWLQLTHLPSATIPAARPGCGNLSWPASPSSVPPWPPISASRCCCSASMPSCCMWSMLAKWRRGPNS